MSAEKSAREKAFKLSVFQFPCVRYVAGMERAHLTALQREQRNRVTIVANELHFKGRTDAMHQYGSAHIAAQQSVFGQVARQGHRVQFIDGCHNFGNGWPIWPAAPFFAAG